MEVKQIQEKLKQQYGNGILNPYYTDMFKEVIELSKKKE